jgi:hypothetical protein
MTDKKPDWREELIENEIDEHSFPWRSHEHREALMRVINKTEEHFKQSAGYGEYKDLVGCQLVAEEKDKQISRLEAEIKRLKKERGKGRECGHCECLKDVIEGYKKELEAYRRKLTETRRRLSAKREGT